MISFCKYCYSDIDKPRHNQIFCSARCRIFYYRYTHNDPITPFFKVKDSDIIQNLTVGEILAICEKIENNQVQENVLKALKLGHYKLISAADIAYLLKKSMSKKR